MKKKTNTDGPKSSFLAAAAIVGTAVGKSADKVIKEYREAVLKSDFPSPNCLKAEELLFARFNRLPEERAAHVRACEPCQGLLVAANGRDGA